jgi:hypothetical protein
LVHNTDDTLAVFDQSDLHREIAVTLDEACCTVERINHPYTSLLEPSISVDGFFSKYSIARKLRGQTVDDDLVCDPIGLGYGLVIVCITLLLNIDWFFV